MKRYLRFFVSICLLLGLLTVSVGQAVAAKCKDPNKDGATIAKVVVGKVSVDVKYVDYPAGGELDPPSSPLNVGLSIRHMPLASPIGTSLLVWHVNYNGCIGKLNVINTKKVGFRFNIIDEKGFKQTFAISKVVQIKKGKYRPEWFRLDGPRQLVFVTCDGVVINRSYVDNLVIIANPVNTKPSASPSASASASASPSPIASASPSSNPSASPSSTEIPSPSPTK